MTEQFKERIDGVEVQGHPSLTALVRILARAVARQQARVDGDGQARTDGPDTGSNCAAAHTRIEGDSAVSRDDDDVM